MIQIWSCRLLLADIEKSLKNLDPEILSFQLQLKETPSVSGVDETMDLFYETHPGRELDEKLLLLEIYQNSRDLRDTISLAAFTDRIKIHSEAHGSIKRNSRTGKISVIQDFRN
jgi:hypothetical protein